jgi:hypothetical protein
MRIIIFFIFISFSFANEKFIISKVENLNNNYINNQVVHIKLNTLIAKGTDINITVPNSIITTRTEDNVTFYSDISFILKDKFPEITISLLDNQLLLDELNISINSNISSLNPPLNFSNIIASNFKILNITSSVYDDNNNLLALEIEANNSNLDMFSLKNSKEEEIEYNNDFLNSKITYYGIFHNREKKIEFSYYNILEKKYITNYIMIDPKIEKISTQSDINPTNDNYIFLITLSIAALIILWLILFYFRRKWVYIVLIILAILSITFINFPKQEVVLKNGAFIHILPTQQSTIFLVIGIDTKVKVLDSSNGYYKVILNNQVGWVKDKYVQIN